MEIKKTIWKGLVYMDNNRLTGDMLEYTKKAITFSGSPAALARHIRVQGHTITTQAAMRGNISCYQIQLNVLGEKA